MENEQEDPRWLDLKATMLEAEKSLSQYMTLLSKIEKLATPMQDHQDPEIDGLIADVIDTAQFDRRSIQGWDCLLTTQFFDNMKPYAAWDQRYNHD